MPDLRELKPLKIKISTVGAKKIRALDDESKSLQSEQPAQAKDQASASLAVVAVELPPVR